MHSAIGIGPQFDREPHVVVGIRGHSVEDAHLAIACVSHPASEEITGQCHDGRAEGEPPRVVFPPPK